MRNLLAFAHYLQQMQLLQHQILIPSCSPVNYKYGKINFDGAANMSGRISGVAARLEQLYPNAKYLTHCRNHALNLVIVAQLPECS